MIEFRDTCQATAKEVRVRTHNDVEYSVSLVGLPNGLETVINVSRAGKPFYTFVLPNDVIEALHEITG